MEKWFIAAKRADFNQISKRFGISPVTARILRNRDLLEEKEIAFYLNGTLEDLHNPREMKDMELAVTILKEKIKSKKKIRIIGDYDIDGVNATHILLTGLHKCGALADIEIPDRMKDGYGINENLIQSAYEKGIDTIITCDNGIAAIDQIAFAKELGMTVIVTDHHDIPYIEVAGEKQYLRSKADAIVNPKQLECSYPFKNLCGAAVAYKLVETLYQEYKIEKSCLYELLEYVAIATVGDVMDLQGENRVLVKYGLENLKRTRNLGLKALIGINQLDCERLSAYHIGFVLGPCINASGRLDTAKRAFSLLQADNMADANRIAGDLKALNDSRKEMTMQGLEKAIEMVENSSLIEDKVLVIYLPDCHESLAGIIAGRVREKYNKPVFVLTKGEEGIKGSGRSIESYHMFEEMNKCKELFTKFGGHPMAAGLSMEEKNIELLRETLNTNAALTEEDFVSKIMIDVPMPIDYITEEFIKELEILEPFGKGNTKPVFAEKDLRIISLKVLGKNKNVLKMLIENGKQIKMEALYFGNTDDFYEYLCCKYSKEKVDFLYEGKPTDLSLSLTYYPSINEFNGRKTLQIIIQNYQ
ncbi:single-stranded-DNA-specific exonuclease RecJ [Anaerosacchariphilus polymeriproducens]|uniref:Single-stranded-DNA-specific exonuclease RecJ n=1 Tax=Anaerosacchariphilus polymeriproducens TaxID=1812858 RepID=A0A371AWR8_9FIRM|nr:single-stranded-DNA-specific exonuclease RecJ [Anaerosacchariphilus polymeriproducens]RDU24003.1 single-stranded-DNA-specific exonuclease RecJ [Anaerosacchariphilus polymeriproducens]